VPDPEAVMEYVSVEFENLLHLTLLLGPQEGRVPAEAAETVHEWIDAL